MPLNNFYLNFIHFVTLYHALSCDTWCPWISPTIDPNGSEFAHSSWISILWFFPSCQSLRSFLGFYCMMILHVCHILLRDPVMKIKCERSAGVENQWCWCTHQPQAFKLYPEVPKKIERTCMSLLYVGMYFIYMAGKVCEGVEAFL